MNAFLLGAGASRGSFNPFRVPVASEFGETLAAVDPCWRTAFPALLLAVQHLGLDATKWQLEPVWSLLDYYAKLQPALPMPPWGSCPSPQIKKALLTVYGQRCDDAASRISDDSTLVRLIGSSLHSRDVLVSFNYDTIAERVAQRLGRQLTSVPHDNESVAFAKPHGSVSWTLDINRRLVSYCSDDGQPLVSSLSLSDVDCGREPHVLGAVPIKSELIREVQRHFKTDAVFDVIVSQWRTVVEAVRNADQILAVGYSFPPEDQYGEFLIREGLRNRRADPRVEFFEVPERAPDVGRRILQVFQGHIRELVYRGPVRPVAV